MFCNISFSKISFISSKWTKKSVKFTKINLWLLSSANVADYFSVCGNRKKCEGNSCFISFFNNFKYISPSENNFNLNKQWGLNKRDYLHKVLHLRRRGSLIFEPILDQYWTSLGQFCANCHFPLGFHLNRLDCKKITY